LCHASGIISNSGIKSFHLSIWAEVFDPNGSRFAEVLMLMSFKDLERQLAWWLERLQQYDFEVLYRKGRIHGNADGLSRWQCEIDGCGYCTRVEEKHDSRQEKCSNGPGSYEFGGLENRTTQRSEH